jgi:hypothetical protein
LHVGKLGTKICRQSLDDSGPPAFLPLARQNVLSDSPIEPNQLAIYRQTGPHTGRPNLVLQICQKIPIDFRIGN